MLIYFLRHGDACSDTHYDDHERPLTELGKLQAAEVSRYLQQQHVRIDTILASPAIRTSQTASIIQEGLQTSPLIISDLLLNGTDFHRLIDYLNTMKKNSILLVGHIPHLSNMISLLLHGENSQEVKMGKCSLAIVESQHPVQPGKGTLTQLTHINALTKLIQP